jgi:class 3 adenylate cyclase
VALAQLGDMMTSNYPILINGPTAEAVKAHNDIALKSLGPIQVKGRAQAVDVYAVDGLNVSML